MSELPAVLERPSSAKGGLRAVVGDAVARARRYDDPFPHWLLSDVLPRAAMERLVALPFPTTAPAGGSGARDADNQSRRYCDAAAMSAHRPCRELGEVFQAPTMVATLMAATNADLAGCFLRIEFARDVDGFWLAPHTDLAVKRFTLQIYLDGDGQDDLGTDLYGASDTWAGRAPFAPGAAIAFIPAADTWHGFARRPIRGVRRSLVINYVTADWRDRGQLAFPDRPVSPT